jgi:hypothetical protein
VNAYDGKVMLAIMDQGVVTVYTQDRDYHYLPREFRDEVRWLTTYKNVNRDEKQPPPGVTWKISPARN